MPVGNRSAAKKVLGPDVHGVRILREGCGECSAVPCV